MNFKREIILGLTVLLTVAIFAAETRTKIAVVDTGIQMNDVSRRYMCSEGHADFTGTSIDDNDGHGTNVAGLIAQHINPATHCLLIIKYYNVGSDPYNGKKGNEVLYNAWDYLLTTNVKYVNMSYSDTGFEQKELLMIRELIGRGTKVIVAAGNNQADLSADCPYYPGCYRIKSANFYIVGARDLAQSNYGGPINANANGMNQRGMFGPMMSGTSMACGTATGLIVQRDSK